MQSPENVRHKGHYIQIIVEPSKTGCDWWFAIDGKKSRESVNRQSADADLAYQEALAEAKKIIDAMEE